MTNRKFNEIISNDISRILRDNLENTLTGIIKNIPESEYVKEEHLNLCKNTVTVSVQLSVQIIFDYLNSLGILNIDGLSEHFERPELTLLNGGIRNDAPTD